MKIAYIIEVIHNSGGMERVLSVCTNTLCQDLDVSIVTLYPKTPIISTNAGGIPSLIEDKETGFLYPYSEPHALAFKIMNLAGNKEELEKVSDNEYCVSHNRHNPENIVRQIIQIYSQIIKDLKF